MTDIIQYISNDDLLVKWLSYAYTVCTGYKPKTVKQMVYDLKRLGHNDESIIKYATASYPRDFKHIRLGIKL